MVISTATPDAFAADLKISRASVTLTGRPMMKLSHVQAALAGNTNAQDKLCRQLWANIRNYNAANRRYAANELAWPGRISFAEIRSQLHKAYLDFCRQYGEDP